ncbi:MAG TPA: YceI family protein [Burkholderiales bacterium]|nr:YceI family protein [Burkholderiales bacterium]
MMQPRAGLIVYATLASFAPGAICAEAFTAVDPNKSAITFVSKQMNVPVEGKFGKFSVQLAFDPAKPSEGRVHVELELATIDTGSDEANDEVKGKGWFDVKSYPTARFVSSAVKSLGSGRYEVAGKLTIKGRTKDVNAPFTFKAAAQGAAFDGAFILKRLDYAIGEGAWSDTDTVANEVQVKFRLWATAAPTKP